MDRDIVIPVPAKLVFNNELNDKRVVAYIAMVVLGVCGKGVEEAVEYCGYSTYRGKNGVLAQFRQVEQWLKDNKYFVPGGYTIKGDSEYCFVKYGEFGDIVKAKAKGTKINIADVFLVLS